MISADPTQNVDQGQKGTSLYIDGIFSESIHTDIQNGPKWLVLLNARSGRSVGYGSPRLGSHGNRAMLVDLQVFCSPIEEDPSKFELAQP